jgi:hypothetical protein
MFQLYLTKVQTAFSAGKQNNAQNFELHFWLAAGMTQHPGD